MILAILQQLRTLPRFRGRPALRSRSILGACFCILASRFAWTLPPPVVDSPLYQCSKGVTVRSFTAFAELRVYVNGQLRGTGSTGATSAWWVDLSLANGLNPGDEVRARQLVGGDESGYSAPVFASSVLPSPPLAYFEPPVEGCAHAVSVHNRIAGPIAIRSDLSGEIAFHPFNEGNFNTVLLNPLVAGDTVNAAIFSCSAQIGTPPTPVSSMYSTKGSPVEVPPPMIDPASAVECLSYLRVQGLVPGAMVTVYDGATLVGTTIAMGSTTMVHLNNPMKPEWSLEARQELCGQVSDSSHPPVSPLSLQNLPPPIIHGPVWAGQEHITVETQFLAMATITVNGYLARDNVFVYGKMPIYLDDPFEVGQLVRVRYTLCGVQSPPAEITVIQPPEFLPAPFVGFPLFACGRVIPVAGLLPQAEVIIMDQGVEIHRGFAEGSTTSFLIGPALDSGQQISAYQQIGGLVSMPGPKVTVFFAPPLPPPVVVQPLVECQREVQISGVITGAFVTVVAKAPPYTGVGFPIGFGLGTSSTIRIPTLPLPQGFIINAKQQLDNCQVSGLGANWKLVMVRDSKDLELIPQIVEPVLSCQTGFDVGNLPIGAELLVFLDGIYRKRVPISSATIHVPILPPLGQEEIRVVVLICNEQGQEDTATAVAPALDPPKLLEPIFHGDPFVLVEEAPAGSLIRISVAGNCIGAGMADPPRSKIYLATGIGAGLELTATVSLCSGESPPSNAVVARSIRSPWPHDVMLKDFQIDPVLGNAQCILFVSGRNVYQGSKIIIDEVQVPTFPWAQILPSLPRDPATLGRPIDTIGGVAAIVFERPDSTRYMPGDVLHIDIENPDGSRNFLQHYNPVDNMRTSSYYLPSSMAELDSDGDGLTDVEESPGAPVDLASLGASPFRQDVFVEVDWMVASDHSHQPSLLVFSSAVDAFANAWTLNIDGSRGIHLFIDFGQGGGEGGDALPHSETITFEDEGPADAHIEDFYDTIFSDDRKGLFHYCVFGHQQPGTMSSGLGDNIGDKFLITLLDSGDFTQHHKVAGAFLHELGHNLGMDHGGGNATNYKPNYPSLMNYHYTFSGVPLGCSPEPYFGLTLDFSYGTLAELDEEELYEEEGICNHEAINWNGNLLIETYPIAMSINKDQDLQILRDYCDWCYLTGLGVK